MADNELIVVAAVLQAPQALEYAGKKMKDNGQIVLTAVHKDGRVLELAS